MNVRVPIPFDGQSQMEVDFLNEPLRIAVELDGSQHLSDAEAYRRDRRKDRCCSRTAISFSVSAEDVGKDLDSVLDSIHAVFGRKGGPIKVVEYALRMHKHELPHHVQELRSAEA